MKRTGHPPPLPQPTHAAGTQPVERSSPEERWAAEQQTALGNAAVQGLISQDQGPQPDPVEAMTRAVQRGEAAGLAQALGALDGGARARVRAERGLLAQAVGLLPPEDRGFSLRALGVPLPQQVMLGALGGWLEREAAAALLGQASAEEQERVARHGAACLLLMALGEPRELLPALCADPSRVSRVYTTGFFFGVWLNGDPAAFSALVEGCEDLGVWAAALHARGAHGATLELVARSPDPRRWREALRGAGALEAVCAHRPDRGAQALGLARLGEEPGA